MNGKSENMLPPHITANRTELEKFSKGTVNPVGGLITILGEYQLFVDPTDQSVGGNLHRDGYWELWVTQAIARLVNEGWTCIDVGANFGYYTMLLAAAVGPTGQVFAFEPQWRLADSIKASTELNGFSKNVFISDFAISDKYGRTKLNIPKHYGGDASIEYEPEHEFQTIEVQTSTLDLLIGDRLVNFVKIDAEGSEEKVWAGMKEILVRNPEIIIAMEWFVPRLENASAFLKDIEDMGFTTYKITTKSKLQFIGKEELLEDELLEMILLKR